MHFDEDHAVALRLQEEFDRENLPTKSSCLDIPGSTPVRDKMWSNDNDKSCSLVDPSWEYVDPTPDIHAMFMQFNKRFFWQTLNAVEVRWSPRMTKCAGLCSYQGRRGLCSIRLSLPLLKLRPRKDLVETLLHEMIHAYLFVTCNNQDRDGHGPEFHKHMYRINRAAGTSISVFHSFHAEVKLYQQHWWRCNGPCQRRPPFFGMVKRAMNRAPGPTDFWWAQHQSSCGGKYVKVREPEGYRKKQTSGRIVNGSTVGSPSKDIRSYFPGKGHVLKEPINGFGLPGLFGRRTIPKSSVALPKNSGQKGGSFPGKGRGGTKAPFSKDSDQKGASFRGKGRGGFGGGMLANKGGGTLVVNAKGKSKGDVNTETDLKGSVINPGSSTSSNSLSSKFIPFSGKGHTLGSPVKAGDKPWLSRLDKSGSNQPETSVKLEPPSPSKRKGVHGEEDGSSKRTKPVNDSVPDKSNPKNVNAPSSSLVACPSCDALVVMELLNDHLDMCLQGVFSSDNIADEGKKKVKCAVCNVLMDEVNLNSRLCNECLRGTKEESAKSNSNSIVSCPMCDKQVPSDDLKRHLEMCVAPMLDDEVVVISSDDDDSDEEPDENGELEFPCPCCASMVHQSRMNIHLNECLSQVFLDHESDPY